MKENRNLKVGDKAVTDFNDEGLISSKNSVVTITDRKEVDSGCQSGILYRVHPTLRNCQPDDWIDADWFDPYERNLL